ncbi:MAG: hypothetical protein ABSF29_09140 [Tepidisphaeraceae bacterium]|jgi:predicted O-linked N-acetylglucosamine transferase (SPINDLY family)
MSDATVEDLNNLAKAMRATGRASEALKIYDRILAARPDESVIHGERCCLLPLLPEYDSAAILRESLEWNRRYAQPLGREILPHGNDRNPQRRLRVGYVSPDFRHHCQLFYTLPLFSRHDHAQFEIYCYARVAKPDEVTAHLRTYADVWRDTLNQTDEEVARIVRQDKIDILVDLTMHMPGGRPLLFARKPAPVQITWLAYPGTTGMPAIDYRLTDPYLDPPGQTDAFYAEKSIRLPHTFWCYDPQARGLEVNPLPALGAGHITFGCLNNFCKVNDQALGLWSRVLKRLPTSRMILYVQDPDSRARITQTLDIDPARIEFVPRQSLGNYLKTYQRIDIGLDTVPYNGHTTSLDSFWMGVPVVTLVGKTVVGRAGWSQLNNLNLKELAAHDEAGFADIAVGLATDLPRLGELRRDLRARMEKSPLMDAALFAGGLEATYRRLWRDWCNAAA